MELGQILPTALLDGEANQLTGQVAVLGVSDEFGNLSGHPRVPVDFRFGFLDPEVHELPQCVRVGEALQQHLPESFEGSAG